MHTTKNTHEVDHYIAAFPADVQKILQTVRATLHQAVPHAEETISYGVPTLKVNGKSVVYFAGYTAHVSVYPLPKGNSALQKQMAPYIAGKGTLRCTLNKPIPYDLIRKTAEQLRKERQAD